MDRQGGAPNDKRNAAYESIFGRPSAAHHQYPRPPPSTSTYAQYQQQTEYGVQSYYYQQQYDPRYDAYAQAAQQQYAQQAYAPSAYRQQPYYSAQYAQQYQQPQQTQYAAYNQASNAHLMPQDQYAMSSGSSSRSTGVIAPQPQPQEPVDAGTEAYLRQGLTPAQAYQAQVYSSDHSGQPAPQRHPSVAAAIQSGRTTSVTSENKPQHGGHELAGPQPPQLGIDPPDARLDLDFLGDRSGNGRPGGEERNGQYSDNAGECC